ncbi:ABC transporter [Pseudoalteromonas sp. SCSIO 43201]|uniref:lipocalin-like domain-containing protein n=1 Tax=Pseudoalteromonas sp. SCSIO 43201 TaxID=2822842 RepID=UPI0020757BE1|nr:lipocalin-like domain-containing protein [Pseudoalteromonas sp. SCSIO 43201]USD30332.1 ABC transporter [Pseudoalteromonas sp. SCSIO 43201]
MKTRLCLLLFILALCVACTPEPANDTEAQTRFFSQVRGTAVSPDYQLRFPHDHGSHPDQGIEWWYITANLHSDLGKAFGVQWTLFRVSAPNTHYASHWWDDQLYFAHFAIQNDESHQAYERYGRAGQIEIATTPFIARLDDWYLKSDSSAFLPLSLHASESGNSINIKLNDSPLVLHGENGYSEKTADGHASMYYSYPFLNASGTLYFNGESHQVSGKAWLDREWSSAFISKTQRGWDWFSIRAKDSKQGALMVFCIRDNEQSYTDCRGTKIASDGKSPQQIEHNEIKLTVLKSIPLDGVHYPSKWQLELDGESPIIIEAINRDSRNQLSIPYWEGRVRTSGGFDGEGFAELVGYQ